MSDHDEHRGARPAPTTTLATATAGQDLPADEVPAAMIPTYTVEVEVRYAETDQMGVVHHSNYLVWFELARTGLCRQSGWHYAEIEADGHYLVVTGTETRHLRGARYGDVVAVECRLERLSSRGLRFAYQVRRGDEVLARGATEHVWVEIRTGRPCRIPEKLQAPFQRLAGRGAR